MTSKCATTGANLFQGPCPLAVISPVIRSSTPHGAGTDCRQALEFADFHGIHDILEINWSAWLDLGENRSAWTPRSQSALYLIANGGVTCRIAAERRTGAVQLSNGSPSSLAPRNEPNARGIV